MGHDSKLITSVFIPTPGASEKKSNYFTVKKKSCFQKALFVLVLCHPSRLVCASVSLFYFEKANLRVYTVNANTFGYTDDLLVTWQQAPIALCNWFIKTIYKSRVWSIGINMPRNGQALLDFVKQDTCNVLFICSAV